MASELEKKIEIIQKYLADCGGKTLNYDPKDLAKEKSAVVATREIAEDLKKHLGNISMLSHVTAVAGRKHSNEVLGAAEEIANTLDIPKTQFMAADLFASTILIQRDELVIKDVYIVVTRYEDLPVIFPGNEQNNLQKINPAGVLAGFVVLKKSPDKLPDYLKELGVPVFDYLIKKESGWETTLTDFGMMEAYELLRKKAESDGKSLDPVKVSKNGILYTTDLKTERERKLVDFIINNPPQVGYKAKIGGAFVLYPGNKQMILARAGYPLFEEDETRNFYSNPLSIYLWSEHKRRLIDVKNIIVKFFLEEGFHMEPYIHGGDFITDYDKAFHVNQYKLSEKIGTQVQIEIFFRRYGLYWWLDIFKKSDNVFLVGVFSGPDGAALTKNGAELTTEVAKKIIEKFNQEIE